MKSIKDFILRTMDVFNGPKDQDELNRKFMSAVEAKDLKKAKLFIKKGAQVNALDKKSRLFLNKGRNIGPKDMYEGTRLHHCATHHIDIDVIRFLLDNGAQVDSRSTNAMTPLHCAAKNGRIKILKFLLNNGAQVDSVDDNGCTPLRWVVLCGLSESTEYLIKTGVIPINLVINLVAQDKIAAARLLILHGADPFRAFDGPQEVLEFFKGDIDWMSENLKTKLKRMQKGKQAFGM